MSAVTPGKLSNLKKLSSDAGIIAAAAMDQRGSLKKTIAKERGVDPSEITHEIMSEFKTAVTKILTPHASAILLDPEFGLEAAKARSENAGLLLAYEKTGYDQTGPGRLPSLVEGWTVAKSIEQGANAIKILLYYSPFEETKINEIKHKWIEDIGNECKQHDIPFFLEFVGYPTKGEDQKGPEYAKLKPEIVAKSMEEYSKDRYHVDVLKVEIPVNMQFVKGAQSCKYEPVYDKSEAKNSFLKRGMLQRSPSSFCRPVSPMRDFVKV